MNGNLEFEKPIIELEKKIEELRKFTSDEAIDFTNEIKNLEQKLDVVRKETFENLTPWQRVQLARHPKRPYSLDYINLIMADFIELHGDRLFSDDKAIVAGLASVDNKRVMVIGQQKGRDTKENIMRSFGSPHPEGYRKAIRLMKLAEKYRLPIVIFIDTPGAYPGIGAEERGQAYAIAYNMMEMAQIKVPVVAFVIGEGGSGGALGIGVADRVFVLENSYYSVISPEGCAVILWKDGTKAPDAAKALKITAKDLLSMGIIDGVVPEPLGGAHTNYKEMAETIKQYILKTFCELEDVSSDELIQLRYDKFRKIGMFEE